MDWKPSAPLKNLKLRASILNNIRQFFLERGVMEVETPLLCRTSVTDPFIQSIPALLQTHPKQEVMRYYLQTSPEYAMKRLLAAGSGDIYQICKAFRQGEVGRLHNPEFTILEWYRLQFDHHQLMQEMDAFLQTILSAQPAEKITYAELFKQFLTIDAHSASIEELSTVAREKNLTINAISDRDAWLDLLMTHCIEPGIGKDRPLFIYDYPASQAALARIHPTNPNVASRFEVYYRGFELANGFHELQNAEEQQNRFVKNLMERKDHGLPEMPIDELFLAALKHGLPDCAGVALGLDRLLMIATQSKTIENVLSFDFSII